MVSRIKIKAGMDIAERRLPQDGRSSLGLTVKRLTFACRHCLPFTGKGWESGSKIKGVVGSLEELGFLDKDVNRLKCTLQSPNGIILVTGPTGSVGQ